MKTNQFSIECRVPDDAFWESYARLWEESLVRSVFQSPNYLRFLATIYGDALAVCMYRNREGHLTGAAFFRREEDSYHFLSDVKADHNFFIFHRNIRTEEVRAFFRLLFEEIKNRRWAMILNNHPCWAPYAELLEEIGTTSGLFWMSSLYSVCPVMQAETPQALVGELMQSREHRSKTNRLINEQKAVVEIFQGDEDLENWLNQFFKHHITRWKNTATPSKYESRYQQEFMRNCVLAWIDDGVIVRFSISLNGERIAFVIGFQEGNTLIHHATSYDAEHHKISPGKVLTMLIAQWMAERGMNRLDFGEGAEAYKYAYANTDMPLGRIFVALRGNLPFILKAKYRELYRKHLRNNPKLKTIYHGKLWPAGQKLKAAVISLMHFDFEMFL